MRRFSREEPDRVLRLRLRLRVYLRRLERHGLRPHAFDEPHVAEERLERERLALLLLALALIGREHDVLQSLREERAWIRSKVDRWRELLLLQGSIMGQQLP